jgi:hypothetical protein
MNRRGIAGDRGRRLFAGGVLPALGVFLVIAGVAMAVHVGVRNASFEQGFDQWAVSAVREDGTNREVVYGPGGLEGEEVPCDDSAYGICVVEGTDEFAYHDEGGVEHTGTAEPLDGTKMVRLGGPFVSANHPHNNDIYVLEQSFDVDPVHPVVEINYDIHTFDGDGWDELRFAVRATDENGEVIASAVHDGFGEPGEYKSTGWQPQELDLSGHEGEPVHLRIESQGIEDSELGTWVYVDAQEVEADHAGPQTTITKGPKAKIKTRKKKAKATFEFRANESGAEFDCSLDGEAFRSCSSPLTVKVKKGKHEMKIRATDISGNPDGSPAEHDWRVKKKKGKKG